MAQKGVLHSNQNTVSVITRLMDAVVIFSCSLVVSFYYYGEKVPVHTYVMAIFALLIFYVVCEMQDFYISWRTTPFRLEAWKLTRNWSLAFILSQGFYSLLEEQLFSGVTQMVVWFIAIWVGLLLYRHTLKSILSYIRERGYNSRRVAIVGAGQFGQNLARQITMSPWMGLNMVGHYDFDEYIDQSHRIHPAPVLGNLDQLVRDAKAGHFDKVYIALPMSEQSKIIDIVPHLADSTCSVYYFPDVFTFELLHAQADNFGGIPVISIYSSPMDGFSHIAKRAFDLTVGALILVLISVPMIIIAAAIKLTSRGPVFFKQNRYGMDGKLIRVWKFRSMKVMENGDVVVQAKKGDSRLTPIGGLLRRTSLDELPQFINVIQGSMSIVGPRPHAVAHNEQYRQLINGYMQRHMVKPGITGWAQVNGWRGETDTLDKMEKRVEYDLEYIQNWSLSLDAKILCITILKGFIDKNAY
jgi:putative colanic acid biosynthesis UDP-glucose lipid carrier transferase